MFNVMFHIHISLVVPEHFLSFLNSRFSWVSCIVHLSLSLCSLNLEQSPPFLFFMIYLYFLLQYVVYVYLISFLRLPWFHGTLFIQRLFAIYFFLPLL